MLRTFELDDYPLSAERTVAVLDRLKARFPAFRATVFAIPGAMLERHWRPMLERAEWVRVCPHGFTHEKRECRQDDLISMRLAWLDAIAADARWGRLFKAPWHGMSDWFLSLLAERGFAPCVGILPLEIGLPTPDTLCWSRNDWAHLDYAVEYKHVQAHPMERFTSMPRKSRRQHAALSNASVRTWEQVWSPDDAWPFVEDLLRPMLLKVNLGCGPQVWPGWHCLDERELPGTICWSAPARLPYVSHRADVILTSHLWGYFADEWYEPMAREIHRVLRRGGVARLAEDATESGYVWRRPGQRTRGTGEIRSLCTKRKVLDALEAAGFSLVEETRPGETRSPHKDVLQGDTRLRRWEKGQKFYVEAVK